MEQLSTANFSLGFILVINEHNAQTIVNNKLISCLYVFRAMCAHRQEFKFVLYSFCFHKNETSMWYKITKITTILIILVILVILDHSLVSV